LKTRAFATVLAAALAAAVLISGCTPSVGGVTTPAYQSYLYMTDTNSGKIYAYDLVTHKDIGQSIATTGKNATGEIAYYKGIGYVAVGFGTDKGVFYFDPSTANPSFTKMSGSVAAQFIAFCSPTKAYVSTYGTGLYTFDPSSRSSLTAVASTSGLTLQEVIVGKDGFVYVADNGRGKVLRIDPSDDSIKATVTTTAAGTTGLVAGTLNGLSGVFVANSGGYDSNYSPLPGSIDFIAAGAADNSTATAVATSASAAIYPARIIQLDNGNLVATGYGHTYLEVVSAGPTPTELKDSGNSAFGSLDIAYKNGLVYVPVAITSDYVSYSNKLFIFDASGFQQSYSPVSVMTSSDGISNIGFYE
jgi:hypothetical protein